MAHINADVIAIKTASPSPRKPKLKFIGNSTLNCSGEPLMELGRATNDKITDVATKTSAAIFLNFLEIEPRKGSRKAPAKGAKIIKHKISLAFM